MLKLHAAMAERGIQPPPSDAPAPRPRIENIDYEFAGLRFVIEPEVFKPCRLSLPLVEAMTALLAEIERPIVADVGTGCGAIALAIAARCPAAHVYALDISAAAVDCAARNAERLGIANVEVLCGPLLDPLAERGRSLDMIVANIPWVAPAIAGVHELHQPQGWRGPFETVAGEDRDGMGLQRALLKQSHAILKPGGVIGLDLDYWQMEVFAEECAQDFDVTIGPGRAYLILRSRADGSTPTP